MSKRRTASCTLCLMLALATAAQALGASKHFRISYEHFNDYAAKAADLYFKTEAPNEKNILSHMTAVCAIYAEKARGLVHMTDVAEHIVAKRDKIYVVKSLRDLKDVTLATLPQDIKLLTELVDGQENQSLFQLGTQVINELRVFERNTENL